MRKLGDFYIHKEDIVEGIWDDILYCMGIDEVSEKAVCVDIVYDDLDGKYDIEKLIKEDERIYCTLFATDFVDWSGFCNKFGFKEEWVGICFILKHIEVKNSDE